MTVREIQDRFIDGLTWKTLFTLVSCTISIVASVVWMYSGIQGAIKDSRVEFRETLQQTRTELKAQIDTVKTNQMREHYQNEIRFQSLEHKIDERK